jgi:hypothetical protein
MRKLLHRSILKQLGRRYGYDPSYLEFVLECAPRTYYRFFRLFALASWREGIPRNAFYAAKLVGALQEDCGPCTQLVTDMALAAGMPAAQIEAVLERNQRCMNEDTALAVRFATAVVNHSVELRDAREEARRKWGDKGVVGLSFATQIGRIFPMLKQPLGFAQQCQRVKVGSRDIVFSEMTA